jgi:dTDP-4-amino-4,6-dideoxy-D-galactose acyltransferase
MEIAHLQWDSDFFGFPVGKIIFKKEEDILLRNALLSNQYKLVYVFSDTKLDKELLNIWPLNLVDCKVQFIKKTDSLMDGLRNNGRIRPLYELTPDLLALALQSGHFSRFKLDNRFINNEFERLYEAWIVQSLSSENETVFGYSEDGQIIGFISLGIRKKMVYIFLIAVDENYQGKHIGKQLLAMADSFAKEHNLNEITVATQEQNKGAMQFYRRNEFSIFHKTYIYHLWN